MSSDFHHRFVSVCVSSRKHGFMVHGYVHVLTPEPSLVYLPILRCILTCVNMRDRCLGASHLSCPPPKQKPIVASGQTDRFNIGAAIESRLSHCIIA